jgi:hypothetical protein
VHQTGASLTLATVVCVFMLAVLCTVCAVCVLGACAFIKCDRVKALCTRICVCGHVQAELTSSEHYNSSEVVELRRRVRSVYFAEQQSGASSAQCT